MNVFRIHKIQNIILAERQRFTTLEYELRVEMRNRQKNVEFFEGKVGLFFFVFSPDFLQIIFKFSSNSLQFSLIFFFEKKNSHVIFLWEIQFQSYKSRFIGEGLSE